MRLGNFTLVISGGLENQNPDGSAYVGLSHAANYSLRMTNHWNDRDCDAEVVIDGKPVGAWRISRRATIEIERPADETGKFTFYKSNSTEAAISGEQTIQRVDKGIVSVTFRPGFPIAQNIIRPAGILRSAGGISGQSLHQEEKTSGQFLGFAPPEAGITGLSGHSNQQFTSIVPLNYDMDHSVTITLRLVCHDPSTSIRPLKPALSGNPIAPPVG